MLRTRCAPRLPRRRRRRHRQPDVLRRIALLHLGGRAAVRRGRADPRDVRPAGSGARRTVLWQPHRIDWWATIVQLVGTLYFNVSTGFAFFAALDTAQSNRLIWRPDALGSICFLVASGLAWAEVAHGLFRRARGLSGWIAFLNLMGSVAFGVSAVAVAPHTRQRRAAQRRARQPGHVRRRAVLPRRGCAPPPGTRPDRVRIGQARSFATSRSAIATVVRCVFAFGRSGITEASHTRRPS